MDPPMELYPGDTSPFWSFSTGGVEKGQMPELCSPAGQHPLLTAAPGGTKAQGRPSLTACLQHRGAFCWKASGDSGVALRDL